MVVRVLALVMGRSARDFHHFHGPHIDEDTECAVDGGDAQAR